MYEGDNGATYAHITVSSDTAVGSPVAVNFTTVDGSAHAPADYMPTTGVVVIAGGFTTDIVVQLTNDTKPEFDSSFSVVLTSVSGSGAVLGAKTTGTVTILDDDPRP